MTKETRNQIFIGAAGTLLATFAVFLFDVIRGLPYGTAFLWVTSPFVWLWNFLQTPVEVQLYWLFLLFFGPVVFNIFLRKSAKTEKFTVDEIQAEQQERTTPEWQNYRKDNFSGVIVRWQYLITGNMYDIQKIQTFCPVDDCILIEGNYFSQMDCPKCNRSYGIIDSTKLKALIDHSLRTKFSESFV
jgi:hypothetical protein